MNKFDTFQEIKVELNPSFVSTSVRKAGEIIRYPKNNDYEQVAKT